MPRISPILPFYPSSLSFRFGRYGHEPSWANTASSFTNQTLFSLLARITDALEPAGPAALVSGPSRSETGVQLLVWESFPSHHGGLVWSWSGCRAMEHLCSGPLPLSLGHRGGRQGFKRGLGRFPHLTKGSDWSGGCAAGDKS